MEGHHQADEGALAGARGADERGRRAGLRPERDAAQNGSFGLVLEPDVLELDFTVESVLINCHYPISQNSFMLQFGVSVQKAPGMSKEKADKLAAAYAKIYEVGFLQDVEIWKHKTRIENPLLCEEDGAVWGATPAPIGSDGSQSPRRSAGFAHAFGHSRAALPRATETPSTSRPLPCGRHREWSPVREEAVRGFRALGLGYRRQS